MFENAVRVIITDRLLRSCRGGYEIIHGFRDVEKLYPFNTNATNGIFMLHLIICSCKYFSGLEVWNRLILQSDYNMKYNIWCEFYERSKWLIEVNEGIA